VARTLTLSLLASQIWSMRCRRDGRKVFWVRVVQRGVQSLRCVRREAASALQQATMEKMMGAHPHN
jgi:hypothetical protein